MVRTKREDVTKTAVSVNYSEENSVCEDGDGRLLTFSAFRMGAYSNKYGIYTKTSYIS